MYKKLAKNFPDLPRTERSATIVFVTDTGETIGWCSELLKHDAAQNDFQYLALTSKSLFLAKQPPF